MDKEKGNVQSLEEAQKPLKKAMREVEEKVSSQLGRSFRLFSHQFGQVSKEQYFSHLKKSLIITNINVSGDREGQAYLIFTLRDAIYLGGILLKLSEEEISEKIKQGILKDRINDAFGKFVNVFVHFFSNAFQQQYPLKLYLKRTTIDNCNPSEVDLESASPFPEDKYCLISSQMEVEENALERLELIFPDELLGIGDIGQDDQGNQENRQNQDAEQDKDTEEIAGGQVPEEKEEDNEQEEAATDENGSDIAIVITEQQENARFLEKTLSEQGLQVRYLSMQQDIRQELRQNPPVGVFLVIQEVDETALAAVIKVRSELSPSRPIVLAGSSWTRSAVIKAVKYGASDVIMIPSNSEDVQERCKNLLQNAMQKEADSQQT